MKFLQILLASSALVAGPSLLADRNLTTEAPAAGKVDQDSAIIERQLVMTDLSHDADLLGDIVAGVQPVDKLPVVTRRIAESARRSAENFRIAVPGGSTKAEAWTNSTDFNARMDDFVIKTGAMATLGANKDLPGVTEIMVEALPCKQCHDIYRIKKQK